MVRGALITYEGLPLSGGGAHALRRADLRSLWAACDGFLRTCTDFNAPDETHIVLHEGSRVPRDFSKTVKKELSSLLGGPSRSHTISGVVDEYTNWWYPRSPSIPELIEWVAARQPFPEHWLNCPLMLGIKARVRLRQPGTSELLPFQGPEHYLSQQVGQEYRLGESLVYIRLSTRSTFFAFFSLPFVEPDESFRGYATFLQSALPFRLSQKHWVRWQLNAKGTSFYARKLSVPA